MKQNNKVSKARYTGVEIIRTDTETEAALRAVMKLTERNKSDAIRWCIRQMKSNLSAGTKPVMKSE